MLGMTVSLPIVAASTALTVTEWETPETAAGWFFLLGGGAVLTLYILLLGRQDTRSFSWYVTGVLAALRIGVVATLAVILLNPQERTQTIVDRPSRLAILVDTSSSMRDPERTPTSESGSSSSLQSRAAAVTALFSKSALIEDLVKLHDVHLFTFDEGLKELKVFRQSEQATGVDEAAAELENATATTPLDWQTVLEPAGAETRLGDALSEAIRELRGSTLAGIVVVSDGGLNAGAGVDSALALARESNSPVKIASVGIGGLERPANVVVAELRAPTEVRFNSDLAKQDPFEITAYIRGDELAGQSADVELLRYPADSAEASASVLGSTTITFPEANAPVEVRFPQEPDAPGEYRYVVRAKPKQPVAEYRVDDNQRDVTISFSERNTAVLVIAGGPMRDYHFVRNLLNRSATVDVDVWLQTVAPEDLSSVSQDADDLLAAFPEDFPVRPISERLAETDRAPKSYDVVLAFDPEWSAIPVPQREVLAKWVARQRGGLIIVAGDVFTPLLADAAEEMQSILDLYPVLLSNRFLLEMADTESSQPFPIEFTEVGQGAGFLQLADNADAARQIWKSFSGIYRAFPTRGVKDLAEVYATFPDPSAGEGAPILFAAQQYGGGRVLYIGSPETWRLRAVSEDAFNTFWTKAIREAGQGRLRQGDGPGLYLLDRESYLLGETIRVRAQLNTPQGDPLTVDGVELFVTDPDGRELYPAGRDLKAEAGQPGQFTSSFRAALPGRYQVKLTVPEFEESLTTTIEVTLPKLEQANPQQNKGLLVKLGEETRGAYFTIEEAASGLPTFFDTSAAESVAIDDRLKTLWDRSWLLYLMVGLLSTEWLTRKLLKLA